MIIPYRELSDEALQALLEDFVTRDGTDYGTVEKSMQDKVDHLLVLLKKGELFISYDEKLDSCGLVTKQEAARSSAVEE